MAKKTETRKPASKPETKSRGRYSTGSVNTDSLKEILSDLAAAYPHVDETARTEFFDRVNSIDKSGNPRKEEKE